MRGRRETFSLVAISAASLIFEIGLTRLFAVQQFHHFAFLVVSLAVMGIAASGALLAMRPRQPALASLCLAFSLAILITYLTINWLPFDSFSIAWDRRQVLYLGLYFLTAATPFFFAGWTVGACLQAAGPQAHRPYAANLIGSALGPPLALGLHALGGETGVILFAAAVGLSAAAGFAGALRTRIVLAAAVVPLLYGSINPPTALSLHLSPYKPLATTLQIQGANHTLQRWDFAARADVVETGTLHLLPGLSLNADLAPPEQAALFLDGDGPLAITRLSPADAEAAALAAHLPAALAYKLRPTARTLILQPGTGFDALIALAAGADSVTLPNDEPLVRTILSGPYADFSGRLLQNERITLSPRASRGALQAAREPFDVIAFALSDPYRPVTSGAFSLSENYILTVQSISAAYAKLADDGLLVITRWLGTPASESARAWASMLSALRRSGLRDPSPHVIAFRGMRTMTMIASHQAWTDAELGMIRSFLKENGWDAVYLPDLQPDETNRFNRLPEPVYRRLFHDLLEDPDETIRRYEFNLQPPTDERPYFFHFFRWRQTPQILAALGQTWQPFGGSGYFVLLALLALMMLLALIVIALPAIGRPTCLPQAPFTADRWLYFGALGAGYLLVEVPTIQRFTLLFDQPALALAVVLSGFLLFSGAGSWLSPRMGLRRSLGLLIILLAMLAAAMRGLMDWALPLALPLRVLAAWLSIAPAGFLMGVPFAGGLRRLEARMPGSIAWAWAANGASSAVSGVLAALFAIDFGHSAVLAVGAGCYLVAWITAPR